MGSTEDGGSGREASWVSSGVVADERRIGVVLPPRVSTTTASRSETASTIAAIRTGRPAGTVTSPGVTFVTRTRDGGSMSAAGAINRSTDADTLFGDAAAYARAPAASRGTINHSGIGTTASSGAGGRSDKR